MIWSLAMRTVTHVIWTGSRIIPGAPSPIYLRFPLIMTIIVIVMIRITLKIAFR